MSPTVVLAFVAAALLAGGIGSLLPDASRWVVRGRRWVVAQSHDSAVADRWFAARAGDPDAGVRRDTLLVPVSVVIGLLLLAVGAPLPGLVVGAGPAVLRTVRRVRRARRRRAVTHAAPLVGRAIADGLDVGFGVRRAITEAARTAAVDGPAGEDLDAVAARLDAGDPLPSALDGWRRRTDEPAHATLVAGLLLYGEAGGELADVLRGQAAALDRARRQAAEAGSAIVQARAAARIVGGIPALSMVVAVVFAPDAVRQVTGSPLGAVLVIAAVGLQVVAMLAVRRLTASDPR